MPLDTLSIIATLPQAGLGRVIIADGHIRSVELGEFGPSEADLYQPDHFLTPGFIDLQINGGLGRDFTVDPQSVYELAQQLPRWGCTAFLPTIITSNFQAYEHSLKIMGEAMKSAQGAQIFGVHLEGPYLNERYKGAHDSQYLRKPNLDEMKKLVESGIVRLVTLAPELPGAHDMVRYLVDQGIVVSAGHTASTYEDGQAAFAAGVSYMTHLFNAMPPIHHRTPGLITSALDPRTAALPYMGVILDGIHVHPALLRMLGEPLFERITLVTDAMAGMGMAPGRYRLAGYDVIVDENSARLDNEKKTLAGSIITIDQTVRNAMSMLGLPLDKAVKLASLNPATVLSLQHCYGHIKPDYNADVVLLSQDLQVEMTLVKGQVVYQREAVAV